MVAAEVGREVDPLAAVVTVAGRLAGLVRSLPDVDRPVVGVWNPRQLATHLAQVYELDAGLAEGGPSPLGPYVDLAGFTVGQVDGDVEREPAVLARRIEAGAERLVAAMAVTPQGGGVDTPFFDGVRLPRRALIGHVLVESLVHGFDLARATGRPWALERAHAEVAVRDFVFELLPLLGPTELVSTRAANVRAAFDVRVAGVGAMRMEFNDGVLVVGVPSDRPVDCHVRADPRALLLVTFKRVGLWAAVARGQMLAWGRKPWLALRLPALVANP